MKKTFLLLLLPLTVLVSSFIVAKPTYAADATWCTIVGSIVPPVGLACSVNDISNYVGKNAIPGLANDLMVSIEKILLIQVAGTQSISYAPKTGMLHPKTSDEVFTQYGALGALGLGMKAMYDNPPITTQDYLATIKPIVPAYASNVPTTTENIFGKTVIDFWRAARNLAYVFFVVILVVIGLMLMFRSKIDPRTTVTLTSAIPNLIISLILITFSLALASLLINVGQLLEEIIKNMLINPVLDTHPLLNNPGSDQVGLNITDVWIRFMNPFTGPVISFGGNVGALNPVTLLLSLVLGIFAFILALQLFFILILRFIFLMVKPIFAPFVFLFGAIPGKGGTSAGWFKGYLVDVLTFPGVLLILNLAMAIKSNSAGVGSNGDPFGMFESGANITGFIVIGMLFIATKVPSFLESALDVKPDTHVSKSGADPLSMAKRVPIVGNFIK